MLPMQHILPIDRPGPSFNRPWTPGGPQPTQGAPGPSVELPKPLVWRGFFGAGEGARTLDPDLGKVVPKLCSGLLAFALRGKTPKLQSFFCCYVCFRLAQLARSC
jgi:hypothetical protein